MSDGMVAQGITVKFNVDLSSMTDGVASAKGIFSDFASSVSSMSSSISDSLSSAFSGLNNINLSGITSGVDSVATELTSLSSDADSAASSFSGLNDVDLGGMTSGIESVTSEITNATSGTGSFKESLDMISSSFINLGSNIGGVISGRLSPLTDAIQQLGLNISNAASGPINSFISNIQNLSDIVGGYASSAFDAVSSKVLNFASVINDNVSSAFDRFTGGVQKIGSSISDAVSGPVNNFTGAIQKIGSSISDAVSGPVNAFTNAIQKIGSNISDAVSGPINNFTSGVQQVGSKIGDAVSGPFNAFTNSIKGFASNIEEAASGPLADLISGIKSLGSNISDAASGPLSTLSGGVKSAFSGVQNMAQGAMDSIKNAFTSSKPSIGDFVGGIRDAASGFLGFAGSLLRSTGLLSGFTDPIGELKNQLADTIQVAQKHQEVMAQTTQAIKSTGDACGMSAQSVSDLGVSLSKTTMFSDDTIQSGENLLLTFTGIGKDVFPATTKTMLDMAQAMGGDTKGAALMLGKALGDPATGLTALTRVGVTFSAQEKEQIKTMMAHNDVVGAQKIMLKELSTEFGGSATAAGKTFAGSLQILQNNLENAKQKIGGALLPILGQLSGNISSVVVPAVQNFADFLQSPAFQSFASGVGKAIQGAFTSIGNVLKTIDWKTFEDDFKFLGQQLGSIVSGLKPPNNNVFKDIGGVIKTVVQDVGDFAKHIGDVVKWFKDGGAPATVLKDALIGIGIAFGLMKVGQFVAMLPGMVAGIWGWAAAQGGVAIATIITALPYIAIGALVVGIIALIILAVQHWGDITKWLTGVWDGVSKWFEGLWKGIQNWFGGVGKWFQDRFTEAYKGVTGAIGGIGQWFQDRWKDIQKAFGSVGNWFHDLWKGVCDDFNNVLGGLGNFATNIWNSVTGAIKAGFNWIIDLVNNVIQSIDNIRVAGFGVNIPLIPHLASGIENFVGGIALVGEKGPELVNLPKGSSVMNAGDTGSLFQGKSNFKYPNMAGQGSSSQPIVVHVHPVVQPNDIHVDGTKLTDIVATRMANRIRMEGVKNR